MIKIDMEMPGLCEVCKLKTWEQAGMFNKAICSYTGKRAKRINDRPKDCPLIEVEEKSCHNCKRKNSKNEINCRLCGVEEEDSEWEAEE